MQFSTIKKNDGRTNRIKIFLIVELKRCLGSTDFEFIYIANQTIRDYMSNDRLCKSQN